MFDQNTSLHRLPKTRKDYKYCGKEGSCCLGVIVNCIPCLQSDGKCLRLAPARNRGSSISSKDSSSAPSEGHG
ncbi:hypothetical protein TNCV_1162281 [Trichonephila clavipes]|nr:hypothetical protein TNCV_1162281 [Trichonephila clavipes]